MDWEFKFITSWDTVFSESFQQQWLQWIESAKNSHVFFHPSLCMAWIESYLPLRKMEPLFCIAEKGNNTIFLPLVLWNQNWKNAWRRIIVPVGYSDFDYHDPLLLGNKMHTLSLNHFYSELLNTLSRRFPFDEFILDGLLSESDMNGFSTELDVAPFFSISEYADGEHFMKMLPARLRKDIGRLTRRLEEKGKLSLVHIKHDPGLIQLNKFLKNHSERWPGAFKAPQFHANLLRYGSANGTVHFSALHVGEEVISWHLGFILKNRFHYYMTAFEPSWSEFSPGKIHLFQLIELAITYKLTVFDLLRGDEDYKSVWTSHHQQIYQLRYTTETSISKLKNLVIGFKNFLR